MYESLISQYAWMYEEARFVWNTYNIRMYVRITVFIWVHMYNVHTYVCVCMYVYVCEHCVLCLHIDDLWEH